MTKTQGNFLVPAYSVRRAVFALEKDKKLFQLACEVGYDLLYTLAGCDFCREEVGKCMKTQNDDAEYWKGSTIEPKKG